VYEHFLSWFMSIFIVQEDFLLRLEHFLMKTNLLGGIYNAARFRRSHLLD
jgi:hypothetical protein